MSRVTWLVCCFSSLALAAPESAAFCPLVVEPSPTVTESADTLQKAFLSVAKDKSGYALIGRPEVDAAMTTAKVKELSSNDALSRVATAAKTKNAGAFAMRVTDRGDLMFEGRVVSADGKLLKSALLSVPRNGEPVLKAFNRGAAKFFDALNGVLAPEPPRQPSEAEANFFAPMPKSPTAPPPPPPVVAYTPTERPNPGTPLRIAGGVIGAGGIATTVVGVVLFANAGTVQQDSFGNVAIADAAKVNGIRAKQGAALGALTAGVAVTLTGAMMFLFAPNAPVTAGLAPLNDGALFAVGGAF